MAPSSQPSDSYPSGDLQATHRLLRATLDATLDMIQVFKAVRNQQGQIVDFTWILNNHTSEKIYGDVVGKRLLECQPGVVDEGIFDAFKQVVETGIPQQYEKQYVHEQFNGWFHQSVVRLDDGVVTTTAEITPRKQSQEQLQRSQVFLQSVIDSSLDVIQVFKAVRNEAGSILDFVWVMNNQKAVAQNGPVIGKSLLDINPGVLSTGIFEHMVEVTQTGVAHEQEQYYEHEQFAGWFYQALVKTDDGVTMTTRDISRQKQAEQEVIRLNDEVARKATDKYQSLFESIDEGFAIVEVIADQQDRVTDVIWREANPGVERHTGMGDWVGKRASEVVPHLEQHWLDTMTQVYQTGEPVRLEAYVRGLDRWIDTYYSRVGGLGSPFIAAVFQDITERKQRQQQQDYLLHLSDSLRPLVDPMAIQQAAMQLLGQHLQVNRAFYGDMQDDQDTLLIGPDYVRDTFSLDESVRFSEFDADLTAYYGRGQTVMIDDVTNHPLVNEQSKAEFTLIDCRAAVGVPLLKGGKVRGILGLHQTVPRHWTAADALLAQETAERTWAAVERAKVEAALNKSQKRFESIANLVPDLLWESQPDGSTNWYNQRWLTYTGQQFEETIGWGWMAAIHPDDREASARQYHEAVEAGQLLHQEHRIRRHDGAYRWFTVSASPLKDENGQVSKMYGAATDIHDRKRAEAALQESEKRLRLAIEATELATWEWNLVTNEVHWNEQHFRLFGMEPRPNPLTTNEFMRHVHPREQTRITELLEQAIAERSVYDAEFCAVLEDGSQRWMSGYGRITEERDGQPIRMSGVMMDVNERRRAEDALHLADRRKDEFLAMLAHELRNPMSTIRSGLGILSYINVNDETSNATIAMMNRQTDHLVRMVDDLLDISRISRDKIELKTERINVVDVVSQAVNSLQTVYQEQQRSLQVQLPTAPIYLQGDATRLSQVVGNLLTNGLRYTGERGQVWVSLVHHQQEALLTIRDNGIGLAPDQLSAIFELFMQVDNSAARSKGGLGLGLTLVKRLVEMHGGQVEAQSDGLGQGSTFTVRLPTLTPADPPTPKPDPQATASTSTQRILVIDDNVDAAFTLTMLLKLKGYDVHTRNGGRAGIEAAETLGPSVILLDLGMPELDGYATCRLIRQQPWGQHVVIIALTGYGQDDDRQQTREAGFDGHLVKPVDVAELVNLLTTLLDKA